jgi:hypothetical protein
MVPQGQKKMALSGGWGLKSKHCCLQANMICRSHREENVGLEMGKWLGRKAL